MRSIDIIKTASGNLWRNKGRTFLTIIAVFIGSFTIALTSAVNIGVNDYIDRQLSVFGDQSVMYFTAKQENAQTTKGPKKYDKNTEKLGNNKYTYTYKSLTNEDIKKIEGIEGVDSVRATKEVQAEYIEGVNKDQYETKVENLNKDSGIKKDFKLGEDVKDKNDIAIPQDYVSVLGFRNDQDAIGKTVKLHFINKHNNQEKDYEMKIVAILNKNLLQDGLTLITGDFKNEVYNFQTKDQPKNLKNKYMSASVSIKKDYRAEEKIKSIKEQADKLGYKALTIKDQIESIKNVVNAITGALIVFGAIALLAASFGIINTLYMSVRERTKEIGLMKAMGLSNRKIFSLFSIEAILIGFWGSVIGVLIAMGVGNLINGFANNTFLKELDGFNLTKFTLLSNVIIMAIVMFISFLAGALPSRKASKKDPIEALRYE